MNTDEMTTGEAATFLGVRAEHIRALAREGVIPARKIDVQGKPYEEWRLRRSSVERYGNRGVDVDALIGKRALLVSEGKAMPVVVRGWLREDRSVVRVSRLADDGRTVLQGRKAAHHHNLYPHPEGSDIPGGELWYTCSRCREAKPESAYHHVHSSRYAGGVKRESYCKDCARVVKRDANRKASTRQSERARQERQANPKPTPVIPDGWLHWSEVAARLDVSRAYVYDLSKRGRIEKHANRPWFRRDSVEKYLEERTS
jgi:excisionase family DNA binding protein